AFRKLSETLSYGSRLGNSAKRFPMGRVSGSDKNSGLIPKFSSKKRIFKRVIRENTVFQTLKNSPGRAPQNREIRNKSKTTKGKK
ncbi:hypothetical protein QMM85_15425, partial [Leptospira santarosai]